MSWGCGLCALLAGGALLVLLLQLLRWLRADGDLTVLWAEWRGKKPENELRGKVVWVTGASSGIGEELAYQLSKIGALLAISARREDELERVKKKCLQISNLSDKDILVLRLDLTDRRSHEAATNDVLKHFGKIDVLVNNGGRSQRSLFVDTNLDVFSAIMELNYLGTISLTKHVLNHMIQRRRGKIVTVSSVMGIMGAPLASGYCASKHALQHVSSWCPLELQTAFCSPVTKYMSLSDIYYIVKQTHLDSCQLELFRTKRSSRTEEISLFCSFSTDVMKLMEMMCHPSGWNVCNWWCVERIGNGDLKKVPSSGTCLMGTWAAPSLFSL
ncbi:dehydrogenase/reductase SDR family member 7 isoform X2 [Numida meleagris]|uniref:dehydrogenase/reductase SDR family member 7 isoform X2 n=1 Tax=Numida meleagris TaxID=8996 RepID=UPI000B3DC131|nr:dehydrogenase/reductase SDR family member 7 isoform X2 [Numida meleagris]